MRIVFEYNVLYISIISTILIVLLLLVRGFFGTKIHRIFFTLAWMIVLVRLILPIGVVVFPEWPGGAAAVYDWLKEIPFSNFMWLWCAGACTAAVVFVVRYIIWGRVLREALPIQKVPDIDEEMFTFMGIRVYVSDRISSPVTFGFFHQKVLLPKYYMNLSREQLKYILIHEKIHIDNHDNLNKFLIIAAVCIHWFNPFAWLMYLCCNRDLEMACDEKVIRQVGESGREEYANVLISLASKEVIGESAYSGFARSAIRERIVMIMGYRGVKKWNYAMYGVAALGAMLVFTMPGQSISMSGQEKFEQSVSASDIAGGTAGEGPGDGKSQEEYETADVVEVLDEDSFGARTYVKVKTVEGVELCFKLLIQKGIAATNGAVLTSYLPDGESWRAGMDDTYSGEVTIPEAVLYKGKQYPVERIGSYSFYKCKNVTAIHIPDTVQEIQEKAFHNCESLKKLRLPSALETMDVNPFMGCVSLEAFEMPEYQSQYLVKDGALYTDFGRFLKVYPQGCKKKKVKLGKDVIQIATSAFYGTQVEVVVLPKNMVRVKGRCFQNSRKLKVVQASRKTRFAGDAFIGAAQAYVYRYE